MTVTSQEARVKKEQGLEDFIGRAFIGKMPSLIPFVNANNSLLFLARRLRIEDKSPKTLYQYTFGIHRYCRWDETTPDRLLAECFGSDGSLLQKKVQDVAVRIERFVGELKDLGLAAGTVNNHVKGVKALFRANSVSLNLPFQLSKRVKFKDRSPTPEELQRLLDIGDLRDRVIISLLAEGGFREGTLALLQYRHVKKDFETGTVPLHVHVEAEITKGHYCDYDTFLGQEAVEYLKLYLESRQLGSPGRISSNKGKEGHRFLPEILTDASPLIRDEQTGRVVKPVRPGRLHDRIHDLYLKAGLLSSDKKLVRYELRLHSIRKYFKTQLVSLGVYDDYIEYMMGHTVSTYHDIQSKGVEFLRGIYAASGLSIRPRTQLSKLEMLKQVAKAWGIDPEKVLVKDASAYPHRTFSSSGERVESYSESLASALKEAVKKDLGTQ